MQVLGLIMARGGSVGVPGKNIRDCAGKPLIVWTIEEAKRCRLLDALWVSTDSKEISSVVGESETSCVFEPYSDGTNPLLERIQWALGQIEESTGEHYDAVADIRCTNPMKLAGDIDGAIKKLKRTGADVVAGVSKLEDHHPSRIKMIVEDRLVDVWPEPPDGLRQNLKPDAYIRNGSIYVISRSAIDRGIHFTSGVIRPWIMPLERSLNIDTELDFLLAEVMLKKR
jgi:CMP-N-acetylneuraminic acid synthetase